MKYCDWLKDWINVYKKPYIKTWKKIKDVIRLYIPDNIKNCELSELNAFIIQKSLNLVRTSRMRVETFDVYHGSLSMAYKVGFIEKDLAPLLIKPKHVRKVGNALSNEELIEFLKAVKGHRYERYYNFCLLTGARRQEALDFTYNDILLDNDVLFIKGTKTDLSVRYVPVFPELYNV